MSRNINTGRLRAAGGLILFMLLFTACSPTKKLKTGEFIVDKVKVELVNTRGIGIPKENLEAFFRQKPNRKLFRKINFFVWWYNLFNDEKIRAKREKRNAEYDRKNEKKIKRYEEINKKRELKGKKRKEPSLKDKESLLLIESVRDIGEPAVVFDSSLTRQTSFQLSRYLFSKGFFDNRVLDTAVLNYRTSKVALKYLLYPGRPYVINKVIYQFDDNELGKLIARDTLNCLLKPGDVYDFEKQQAERQRITDLAVNSGYYFFENAYSSIVVDSAFANHSVSIHIRIKKFAKSYGQGSDSLIYVNHPKLRIRNIYLITEQFIGNVRDASFRDTLHTTNEGMVFLLNQPMTFRPQVIVNNVDLYKGQLFRRDSAQLTYRELLGLGIFKNVSIQFLVNQNYSDQLDCYIICNPLIKQSLTAETEGTNTSGNLGVDGSLVYQNRNFFKGGEYFETKLQGALVAQSQFKSQDNGQGAIGQLPSTFNTLQFGPELTFAVPRAFFPFSLLPFKKEMSPRTYLKSSVNFQRRPEFSRVITSIDYGFSFKTNENRIKHDLVPFEAYYVNAQLSQAFQNTLTALNDAFLVNSFQDHITTLSKYTLSYTSKQNANTSSRPVSYVRWSISSSGNLLRAFFNVAGGAKDSLGRYLLYGIPFAQFIKTDIDYRFYVPVRKKSRVVYRVAGGIGKPLSNLSVLPYEQSFFSGGPNSVRAWRARTLGPGGYDPSQSTARYDKIGDILLEGNVEYRFHIISSFNGAFFLDAGNIWRLNPDAIKPRGEFVAGLFLDQIALGGGFGMRWDLDFFVLRLDLAAPLKDPKLPAGQRWTFNKRPWDYTVANFGIGYPF